MQSIDLAKTILSTPLNTSKAFRVLCLLAALLCLASVARAQAAISLAYNGSKMRVTEKQFLRQQKNQGFACTASFVGRTCKSKIANYLGFPSSRTEALFDRDRLISIWVVFDEPTRSGASADIDDLITVQMVSEFGEPTMVAWPEREANGNENWIKQWKLPNGVATFTHTVIFRHLLTGQDERLDSRGVLLSLPEVNSKERPRHDQ